MKTFVTDDYLVGIYYEAGKEPGPDQPPKLHLLIESNDEFRVSLGVLPLYCECILSLLSRSNKLCARSSVSSSRPPLPLFKQNRGIPLLRQDDTAWYNCMLLVRFRVYICIQAASSLPSISI